MRAQITRRSTHWVTHMITVCAVALSASPLLAQEATDTTPPKEQPQPQANGASAKAADDDHVKLAGGVAFTKPRGWVVDTPKRGAAAALYLSGDKSTQIEVRSAELTGDQANSYFSTFHSSLAKARLERASSEAKTFGTVDGRLSEYTVNAKIPRAVLVFEFTTKSGAWLVVAMIDSRNRDVTQKDFEALLTSITTD